MFEYYRTIGKNGHSDTIDNDRFIKYKQHKKENLSRSVVEDWNTIESLTYLEHDERERISKHYRNSKWTS
jgi:hypothetical protein